MYTKSGSTDNLICNLLLLLLFVFTEQMTQHHGVTFGVKPDRLYAADLHPCPYDIIKQQQQGADDRKH